MKSNQNPFKPSTVIRVTVGSSTNGFSVPTFLLSNFGWFFGVLAGSTILSTLLKEHGLKKDWSLRIDYGCIVSGVTSFPHVLVAMTLACLPSVKSISSIPSPLLGGILTAVVFEQLCLNASTVMGLSGLDDTKYFMAIVGISFIAGIIVEVFLVLSIGANSSNDV
jgi:hypothetical protein